MTSGSWIVGAQDTWSKMNPSSLSLQIKMEDMLPLETMQKEKSLVKEILVMTYPLSLKIFLLVDGFKHNLLSISQLCDKGFKVIFEASHWLIKDIQNDKIIFIGIDVTMFTL